MEAQCSRPVNFCPTRSLYPFFTSRATPQLRQKAAIRITRSRYRGARRCTIIGIGYSAFVESVFGFQRRNILDMRNAVRLLVASAVVLLPGASIAGGKYDGNWITNMSCEAHGETQSVGFRVR